MAKTIIIDTQVTGVEEAVSDIGKIDNAVDGVNSKKISINLDTEKLNKQTEALQKTGDNISKLGEGIAGAFTLANGVVGTMGASIGFTSEEIENAQQKSAAFLGIMQSLKPVTEGVSVGFKILGAILKTNPIILLATIIGGIIVSFMDLNGIIEGVKKGFKAVGDAVSEAFDFIVSGVKYAIDLYTQYLDLLTFGLFDINDAYKGYIKSIDDANKAEKERIKALEKEREKIRETISQLEAKAKLLDAEIKLIEQQKEAVTRRYDDEIAFAKASGKETYAIEQQKLEDLIEFTKKEIALKEQRYEIERQLMAQNQKFAETMYGKELTALLSSNSEVVKNQKKTNEDRKANVKKLNDDLANFERDLKVNELTKQKENYDKWKALEEEKTKKAKEEAQKRADWEKQVLDDLAIVQRKNSDDYVGNTSNTAETNKQIWGSMYSEIARSGNETATKDLDALKELNEQRIQAMSDTLSILSNLTELFAGKSEEQQKKAFKVQKAINIANAIIDTYKGANSVLASGLPPPFNFIAMAGVITAGLLNVKNIASTEFGSGATSGASSSGIGSAPSLPSVDTSSTPFQFPSSPTGQTGTSNMPNMFVSVSEINDTQRRVNVAEANATFG